MDDDLYEKTRKSNLTKKGARYVAAREAGVSKEKSAIFAGGEKQNLERSSVVQAELAKARAEFAAATGITKENVLAGLKQAADFATVQADPIAMVRAWSEIGKMLGLYAPVQHQHQHALDKKSVEAMKQLSDAELHKLANGRVIEGEVIDVTPEPTDVSGVPPERAGD